MRPSAGSRWLVFHDWMHIPLLMEGGPRMTTRRVETFFRQLPEKEILRMEIVQRAARSLVTLVDRGPRNRGRLASHGGFLEELEAEGR